MNDATLSHRTAAPNLWRINLVGLSTIVRKESRRVVRIAAEVEDTERGQRLERDPPHDLAREGGAQRGRRGVVGHGPTLRRRSDIAGRRGAAWRRHPEARLL